MKNRAGFTLGEVMVALVMTAVIGAAVTGVFVTQSRFFDTQEKAASARSVGESAINMIVSELRMIEQTQGVVSATNRQITLAVPYAMGVICDTIVPPSGGSKVVTISRLPADTMVLEEIAPSGYAHRQVDGSYRYVETTQKPPAGSATLCAARGIRVINGGGGSFDGRVIQITKIENSPAPRPLPGAPVLLYQLITYEFKASALVSGRVGLYRRTHSPQAEAELLAPFDTTAKFRFYASDAPVAQDAVPPVANITGVELMLDGLSLRPEANGNRRRAPVRTSVFFKNRQ